MSKENVKTLGERIKEDIKRNNLNGSAIARKMDVSRQVINQIDLRKKFDIEFLQKLKVASGLDYTNYVFNPKHDNYEPIEKVNNHLNEPDSPYKASSTIELSLAVVINTQQNDMEKLKLLITSIRREADKYGFTIK